MKKRLCSLILALCLLILAGCENPTVNNNAIKDVNALEGRRIGVDLAWPPDYVLSSRDGKDLTLYRYNTTADMLMALYYRQVDAICVDALQWLTIAATNGDALHRVEDPVFIDGFVAYMAPDCEALRNEFNQFLAYYHQTDEYAEFYQRLMAFDGLHYQPGTNIHPNGNGKTIHVAYGADYFPFCFEDTDGSIAGYDIEVLYAFADYSGYHIELTPASYDDLYYSIVIGRYDMGVGTLPHSFAEEAELSGIFVSDSYYDVPLYLVELSDRDKLRINSDY